MASALPACVSLFFPTTNSTPAAVACLATAIPNRRQPPARRSGVSPSVSFLKMGEGGGNEAPTRSYLKPPAVITTPSTGRRLWVKGPLPSADLLLDTERSSVRAAYQASAGTFIEAVLLKAYPECISITVPHERLECAFEAVESLHADIVVLPIENASTGSYHRNYDLLLSHKLEIVGEVQMDVKLCLLALPGVKKDDLRTIFSHPQDLAQCELSLYNLGVSKKNVDHEAAEIISNQNLRYAGAIGSARAAELYGLNILEHNFQDASPNVTRYLILGRAANLLKEHGQYKTSIVFGLEEGPGTLYKALAAFWKREINLTKIESRPNKGKPMRTLGTQKQFNYIFYVDFEASMAEVRAQNALRSLEEISSFLRVLGCYPFSTTI